MHTATSPAATKVLNDPRWQQVRLRDARADGLFVYSVRTTGIYCRPCCGARLPRPENVAFHADAAAAEAAGFQPCKRCRPQLTGQSDHLQLIARACRFIEDNEQTSLARIAEISGLSRFHFHRLFKHFTGVTPGQYAKAVRANRMRSRLPHADRITDAMYDSGYQSSGRFYAAAPHELGMTPSAFRNNGAGTTIRFAVRECSLGLILVAATERGVCTIFLGDDAGELKRSLEKQFAEARIVMAEPEFEEAVAQVVAYVDMKAPSLELPLDIRGTAFQTRVWRELQKIPRGSTITYLELAQRIGAPGSVRAVAGACAANTLAVAIPCHRVVRSDGSLSGYRWGVERKRKLLERERVSD